MKKRILFFLFLLTFLKGFSQFSLKKFKDGYALQNRDTVKCKIFSGLSVNPYEQVVIKYKDSKFEDATTYFAASIIRGYGFKEDTVMKEYRAFSRDKKGIINTKKEYIFGFIMAKGYFQLLEHTAEKVSRGGNAGGISFPASTRSVTQYYLFRPDNDSVFSVSSSGFLSSNIDEEMLKEIFKENVELVAGIKKKIKIQDLQQYVNEYNAWYEKKKNKEKSIQQ